MTSAQNRRHLTPLRVYRNVLYAAAFKQAQGLLDATNQFESVREAIASWQKRGGSDELVQFIAYAEIFFEWKGDHIVTPAVPPIPDLYATICVQVHQASRHLQRLLGIQKCPCCFS